mgnify:FL=1
MRPPVPGPAGMSLGAHRVVVADASGAVIGWAPVTVTAGDDALAGTGGDVTAAVAILLGALVALGLGALLVRRRRHKDA